MVRRVHVLTFKLPLLQNDVVRRSFDTLVSHQIRQLPLTISLKGELPPHLIDTPIPLQLSLSLPEPYNQFLQPIIHEEATHVQNLVIRNLSDSAPISTAILLPTFLPLPSTFDHYNKESWVELHKGIAHWMSTLIERKNHSQDWEWGREAYWMAFAAAYTNFPNHSWPSWDTTIELDGPFILGWFYGECNSTDENMDDSEEDSDDSDMGTWGRDREVRKNIWQRFRMHVWAGRSIFI